jgi:hypothetical protein
MKSTILIIKLEFFNIFRFFGEVMKVPDTLDDMRLGCLVIVIDKHSSLLAISITYTK